LVLKRKSEKEQVDCTNFKTIGSSMPFEKKKKK
jgi:hypothetical protein